MTVYGKSRILALPDISPSLSQGIGQGREIGRLGGWEGWGPLLPVLHRSVVAVVGQ